MLKLQHPEIFRENIRTKLKTFLPTDNHAINLEKGVFNYTIQEANFRKIVKKWENPAFTQLYLDHLRSVYINLKNTDLIHLIECGEIPPQNIAFMTHQEYEPIHWKELIERQIKRNASKYTTNIEASTDMYTCKKCKSKRCTYYELQTRSADEPATIFVTCIDCGKTWKS